jgi:hypothetical protein
MTLKLYTHDSTLLSSYRRIMNSKQGKKKVKVISQGGWCFAKLLSNWPQLTPCMISPNFVLRSCWNLEEWFFGFYPKTFFKIQDGPTMDQRDITIGNKNLEIV